MTAHTTTCDGGKDLPTDSDRTWLDEAYFVALLAWIAILAASSLGVLPRAWVFDVAWIGGLIALGVLLEMVRDEF